MAEYIDRRQIRYTWWQKQDGTITDGVTLQSVIDDIPTADVVPVVRCKDCKYYETHKPSVTLNCERGDRLVPMMPDDYCSYGERK